ncbi:MAG: HEAT repeat domain-containing protein [Planctomycetes bacterium]|nr:HEAT repeat domain-containing protein [Planctomycetota bacterium]
MDPEFSPGGGKAGEFAARARCHRVKIPAVRALRRPGLRRTVSRAHDNAGGAIAVNTRMALHRTTLRTRVALAALCCLSPLAAQVSAETTARLAAAKLAENDGRLAEAESELRAALGEAAPARQLEVSDALAALLLRRGRSAEALGVLGVPAQNPAAGQDPIGRLIAVLDTGAATTESVKDAIKQLETLGPLVVPPLLDAFPQLGPFGIHNALQLLRHRSDPRIVATLTQALSTGDPAVVTAIASHLEQMPPTVAVPLAHELVRRDVADMRFAALAVLVRHDADDPATRALAMRLAESQSTSDHRRLWSTLEGTKAGWLEDVLQPLMTTPDRGTRAGATLRYIQLREDMTEDRALELIDRIDDDWLYMLYDLGQEHPDWVRVGAKALARPATATMSADRMGDLVRTFRWEEAPELAVSVFLGLPLSPTRVQQPVLAMLRGFTNSGWKLPADLDSRFADKVIAEPGLDWRWFVRLLPDDAEERALAVYRARPGECGGFVETVVERGRPWHRLVAARLLAARSWDDVSSELLDRDWSGVSADTVAQLVEFASRWPRPPVNTSNYWDQALVRAFTRHRELPPAVIEPLVDRDNFKAWKALADREPRAALEWAKGRAELLEYQAADCLDLVARHGGRDDLPLVLRALMTQSVAYNTNEYHALARWLQAFAPGHPAVIALAKPDARIAPESRETCMHLAEAAASTARIENLAALLALLPDVPSCRHAILSTLAPQARSEHAPILRDFLATEIERDEPLTYELGRDYSRRYVLDDVIGMLVSPGAATAVPVLRRLLDRPRLSYSVRRTAARKIVEAAADEREPLILAMLESEHPDVVHAALSAPELAAAALRERATAAVIRMGDRLRGTGAMFDTLAAEDRVEVAKTILDSDRLPEFDNGVIESAMAALAATRDPLYVAQFARVAMHPDENVRLEAARRLGNSFDERAVPHLLALLKDEEDGVRAAAQHGLDQIANYLDERAKWEKRFGGK